MCADDSNHKGRDSSNYHDELRRMLLDSKAFPQVLGNRR